MHARLFGQLATRVDGRWLAKRFPAARLSEEAAANFTGKTYELAWGSKRLTIKLPVDAEHRAETVRWTRAQCDRGSGEVESVLAGLARTETLLFLGTDDALTAEASPGPVSEAVRALQRELAALVVLEDRVVDPQGRLLVTLSTDEEDGSPPTAQRVARRSLVLAAVAARGVLEGPAARSQGDHAQLLEWMDRHGLWSEAELEERELLHAPKGSLQRQQAEAARWRIEGLAVLSWALGLSPLPAYDVSASADELAVALGLFSKSLPRGLTAPTLRPNEELERLSSRLFAIHWRTTHFSLLPAPIDFRETVDDLKTLSGIALAEGDLAIGGVAIARAPSEEIARVHCIAVERHRAVNWLGGDHAFYSEVGVST